MFQFLDALGMAADLKGISEDALHEKCLAAQGPTSSSSATVSKDAVLDRLTDSSQVCRWLLLPIVL